MQAIIHYMKIIKLVNPNIFYRCIFSQAEHNLSIPIYKVMDLGLAIAHEKEKKVSGVVRYS